MRSQSTRHNTPATHGAGRCELRPGFGRGIAMVQVMVAMAVAVVLSLAVLSSSVLQSQSSATRGGGMQADALADSGLNLALYYLENPTAAPMTGSDGYWTGENNISFGSSVPGKADVTVTRTSNTAAAATYTVNATGRVGENVAHTAKAVIKHNKGYTITRAVSFSANATVEAPLVIHGAVQCKGSLSLPLLHSIDGVCYSVSTINILGIVLGKVKISSTAVNIPNVYTINNYKVYSFGGRTYRASELTQSTLGGSGGVTLGPTANNPAGIYYYSCNNTSKSPTFTLAGNVTMNGTLVVDNAVLQINGDNNVITAQRGFPAVIASKDVLVLGGTSGVLGIGATGSDVRLNGVVWLGGWIRTASNAVNGDVTINGALLFGNGGSVDPAFNGKVTVWWDASRVYVPDLDARNPSGMQIVSWER